ncbi:histidine phosphatase family protein [Pontibacter liquoris]|uniref:histidine phosphatase family protein n=1 Tax=Pontibacter liquoris TaxID=2905677 RepID=UPI001FA78CFC|nr:histidine phosphatase family protein [Pontibacter liquoris]
METTSSTPPKQIFLIRHARPLVQRSGLFSARSARGFLTAYDAAEVEAFVLQHEAFPYKHITKVYCSTLLRSQLTAKAIFGEKVRLVADARFREFERKIFPLPLLRLPLGFWLLTARLLWFLGLNHQGIESFRQARQRAQAGATLLATEAQASGIAVLVAHGLLNSFILRYLKKSGWRVASKGGHGYVSVNVLEQ